jgi:hypothetical protein
MSYGMKKGGGLVSGIKSVSGSVYTEWAKE